MVKDLLSEINEFWDKELYNNRLGEDDDTSPLDPNTDDGDDRTIRMRTAGITFESLYRNIASYNYTFKTLREIKDNVRWLTVTKTYVLPDDLNINIVTKTNFSGRISSVIDASGPLNKKFTRVVEYEGMKKGTVVYGVEEV